jgi:hypothetical protein
VRIRRGRSWDCQEPKRIAGQARQKPTWAVLLIGGQGEREIAKGGLHMDAPVAVVNVPLDDLCTQSDSQRMVLSLIRGGEPAGAKHPS